MADAETIVDVSPVELTDEQLEEQISGEVKEQDGKPKPTPEPVPEQVSESTPEPTPEPAPEPVEEYVKITKDEWEKTQRRIEEKEKFIQRQADEVGKRRKSEEQLRQEIFNLKNQLTDVNMNHAQAMEIQDAIRARETQLSEAELRTITEFNRNSIKTVVPDADSLIDDMVDLVREDGVGDNEIRAFRDNPYMEPPGIVINLAKRAILRRELQNRDSKIAALEAELASLKTAPKDVVKKIEKALKEPSQMTNNSGQASSTKQTIEENQIPHMTDAELERLLKESS